jgi:DNA-binding IclR family transcriptional regulator
VPRTPVAQEAAGQAGGDGLRGDSPRSVARVVEILGRLAEEPHGLSLSQLSQAMAVPKSSLLNLLRGLVGAGYVAHTEGGYRLGGETYRLAGAVLASRQFPEIARPVLQKLAEQSGETALVGVPTPDRQFVVYVDKVESRTAIRFAATVGDRRPLYCAVGGQVLLAFQPAEARDQYLRQTRLVAHTPRTVTDKRKLRAMLDQVRAEGVAVTQGEMTEGVAGVGAPIFDNAGHVMAAVIIAGPQERIAAKAPLLTMLVRNAGADISRLMGYAGEK